MEDSSNSEAHALKRWTVRTEPGGQHFLEVRCKEKPRRSAQCSRWARNAALPHGAVDLLGNILLDGHLDLQAWSFAEITDAHWSRCDTKSPVPGLGQVRSSSALVPVGREHAHVGAGCNALQVAHSGNISRRQGHSDECCAQSTWKSHTFQNARLYTSSCKWNTNFANL